MLVSIDYITIILYTVVLILIGIVAHRKQTEEDFLISGRKVGILSGLATINATKTGAIIFVFTALLYQYGFSAIWYFIGIIVGYLIFLPFATKLFRISNSRYYTLANYFKEKYSNTSGYMAAGLTILIMIGFLSINLIAATKVLTFFTPLSFITSAILIALIVLIYLVFAGFSAVVKTDVFQYLAIIFILFAFAFVLGNETTIPNSDWGLFSASVSDVLGFLIIGILFPFASPDLWQRIYAMKNEKTMKKSVIGSIVVFAVVSFILTLVGLLIKSALPELDPDFALVSGLSQLLPVGLSGLAVVVFFAALMSSIDTYIYTSSSSIVQDLINPSEKQKIVKSIKSSILGVTIFGTLISILLQDLISASFIFASFVVVLAIPAISTWINPKIKSFTLSSGFVVGTVVLITFIIIDLLNNNLTTTIVLKGLVGSLIGLLLGSIIGLFKKSDFIEIDA